MITRPRSLFRRQTNLILAAGGNLVRRDLLRTLIVTLSLGAILFPFLVAIAISEGIKLQSRISVEEGADFYVAADAAGSSAPLPLADIDRFRNLQGVSRIVPRIVGRAYLEDQPVVIVGMPGGNIPHSLLVTGGRPIESKGEVVVGAMISDRYNLYPGMKFYMPINKWKHFTVVGVFSSKSSMWSSSLIYMSLEDAGELFRMKDMATDLLIYAEPEQSAVVNVQLQMENANDPPFRAQSRELVHSYFQRGFNTKTGIFTAFYLAALALAIPFIFILTGLGWTERRKEIGTLKAIGWQTLDIVKVVVWENVFISILAACLALVAALIWIHGFNGFFIAQFFIGEAGSVPAFPIPARFVPISIFLAFLLTLTLTMTASLYNTWRLASTAPAETMR